MNFAGIGPAELLLILIIALLVFGPTKLPEIAKDLGKTMGKWRKALEELQEATDISKLEAPSSPPSEADLQASAQKVVRPEPETQSRSTSEQAQGQRDEQEREETEVTT